MVGGKKTGLVLFYEHLAVSLGLLMDRVDGA